VSHLSQSAWPSDSVILRVLSERLADKPGQLAALATTESLPPIGIRNLVQLIALIPGGDSIFRQGELVLAGARLAEVAFRSLNLDGVSFRGCDLTGADFAGSTLRGAKFEGSVLKNTRFTGIPADGLQGAAFGDCEHFESIIVGEKKGIETHRALREWLARETGAPPLERGPCAAALQLLQVFRKFVHVNGQSRTDVIDFNTLTRGRQFPGAPDCEACMKAAIDFGYLKITTDVRKLIRRPDGTRYGEIITFVKGSGLSDGLRSLLDSLCTVPGCRHWSREFVNN